jgi:hypothetical protein
MYSTVVIATPTVNLKPCPVLPRWCFLAYPLSMGKSCSSNQYLAGTQVVMFLQLDKTRSPLGILDHHQHHLVLSKDKEVLVSHNHLARFLALAQPNCSSRPCCIAPYRLLLLLLCTHGPAHYQLIISHRPPLPRHHPCLALTEPFCHSPPPPLITITATLTPLCPPKPPQQKPASP